MKTIIKISLFIATGIFIILSCSRNDSLLADMEDPFKQADLEATVEAVLEKVDELIDKEISMLEKYNYTVSTRKSAELEPCSPTIEVKTPEKSKFPKTITLDYGEGCIDADSNFRAGKIIVHITGPHWEANTVRHAKLVDYIYNDLKIDGDRHSMNKGTNEEGYYVFDVKNSQKIWTTDGRFLVDRDWTRVRTYNRGSDLTTKNDDEVWVTGSAKIDRAGVKIVKEITVPLYRPLICQHFQSGIISTTRNDEKTSELDYGTYVPGECDNTATWTNGVKTKIITLKTGVNYYKIKQ